MHNFGTFFFWPLAACILWQGSLAEDQSGYVCLIDKPNPNHCENFYLTELQSLLNTQLNSLVDQHGKLKGQLQEMQDKLEGQLKGVEAKLDGQLKAVQTKFEESQAKLLAGQAKLDTQLQAVVNQLQALSNKIDAAKGAVPASSATTIPPGFELIGSRYFRLVKEWENWETAERRCRDMGGYLASFRNEEEFNAIQPKLSWGFPYWLGINNHNKKGHFVSVASHKPAPFLKWARGEPDDTNHEQNCVYLYNGKMGDGNCNSSVPFICQADNET